MKLYNFTPMPAQSIFAIDISPFGQSLALVPAMRALRAAYPGTRLVAAASNGTCELLSVFGIVDDIIGLGVIKYPDRGAGTVKRFLTLVRRSRRFNFDLVLDFSPRVETQIISRLVMRVPSITPSRLPGTLERLLELGGVRRSPGQSASSYSNVLRQGGVTMNDALFVSVRQRLRQCLPRGFRFATGRARSLASLGHVRVKPVSRA
jgi:hypothetical protein